MPGLFWPKAKRLPCYFQAMPGQHSQVVRFDYEPSHFGRANRSQITVSQKGSTTRLPDALGPQPEWMPHLGL